MSCNSSAIDCRGHKHSAFKISKFIIKQMWKVSIHSDVVHKSYTYFPKTIKIIPLIEIEYFIFN